MKTVLCGHDLYPNTNVSSMKKYSFMHGYMLLMFNKIRVKLYFRIVTSVLSPIIVYFILYEGGIILCDGRRTYLPRPSHDMN